jgi:membrane protein YdbS with pleckstrin-like domain
MSELTWPLRQKWFWTLFLVLLATVLGAFLIVYLIISLSSNLIILALVAVLIMWIVVRSYKNWSGNKAEKERGKKASVCAGSLLQSSIRNRH